MTPPRCHCARLLARTDDGYTCPHCHRTYADTATLPACKHSRTERVGGDAAMARVRCVDCGRAAWLEIPIDEVTA